MKAFKFFVFLAFLASAGSLAGNWFLYQRYQAERAASQQFESRAAQLEEQNGNLQKQASQAEQFEQELGRVRDQLKDYVKQRDGLKKDLDENFAQMAALKKQIQTIESEKKKLEDQLNVKEVTESAVQHEASKVILLPAAPPAPTPQEGAPPSKLAKEKPKKETSSKTIPKETSKEPPKAVVKTKATPSKELPLKEKTEAPFAPLPAPSAPAVDQRPLQVLSVNRQFKFVVINGGMRGSIKVGDTLRVEQNGKLIGRIQVEKLYENFSACNIVEEIKPAQIREGDLVRLA